MAVVDHDSADLGWHSDSVEVDGADVVFADDCLAVHLVGWIFVLVVENLEVAVAGRDSADLDEDSDSVVVDVALAAVAADHQPDFDFGAVAVVQKQVGMVQQEEKVPTPV